MDDPDVILGVDAEADRLAEHPVVGQRLRPERIDFEARRLDRAAVLRGGHALEHMRRRDQAPMMDATKADPISTITVSRSSVDELLQALALEVLSRVDVALRVDSDAADPVESARPASRRRRSSTRPRACRGRARTPSDPGRRRRTGSAAAGRCENARSHTEPSPSRRLRHDRFLHERAVLAEHLNAVVAAVADIDVPSFESLTQLTVRNCFDGGPLGSYGPGRLRPALRRRRPSAACRRPSWRRRRRCDGCRSRRRRRLRSRRSTASTAVGRCKPGLAVVAARLPCLADLQQELSRARELEDVCVLRRRRAGAAPRPRAPAVSVTPAAAIQTLPCASTAIPPGDRGHS